MKKVILVCFTVFLSFSLIGCNNQGSSNFDNPYFEDKETQSWEDTEELFVSYMFKVKSHYEETNKYGDLRPNIDRYVEYQEPSYLGLDTLTKEDFSNYALSNDLEYMSISNLYGIYYSIENMVNLVKDTCSEMNEGETCTDGTTEIGFYREGWNLYIKYTENKNEEGQTTFNLYFYRNEENLVVLDAKTEVYKNPQDEVYKYQTVSLVEGVSETNEEITRIDGSFTFENSSYKKTTIDILQGVYTYFEQNQEYEVNGYYSTYYDFYQEVKWHYENKEFYDYKFTKFNEDVMMFNYKEVDNTFFINLMEFQSWNKLILEDGIYHVYLDDQLLVSQEVIVEENEKSEYPYILFTGSDLEDKSYLEETAKLYSGYTLDTFTSSKTDLILSYSNLRAYITENRTLEESFNLVYNKFNQPKESK